MPQSAGIYRAVSDVVTYLNTQGVAASLDGSQVEWPGVWVWPGTISPELLSGDGSMLVPLQLAVPNTEAGTALQLLDELLAKVLDLVSPEGDIIPQLVQPPGSNPLPGYQVTIRVNYERTDTP